MNGGARTFRQAARQQLFQAEEVCLERLVGLGDVSTLYVCEGVICVCVFIIVCL